MVAADSDIPGGWRFLGGRAEEGGHDHAGDRAASNSRALVGRVALITGASGGIGQALGRRLAAEGARLALGYGANAAPAEDLAGDHRGGGHAVPVQADLRGAGAPAALIEATEDKLGPVDVLVSNAGLGRRQSFAEIAGSDFDDMIAVNLRAPFLLAQRVVPGMPSGASGESCSSPPWLRSPAEAWEPITRRRRPGCTDSRITWPSASPATA